MAVEDDHRGTCLQGADIRERVYVDRVSARLREHAEGPVRARRQIRDEVVAPNDAREGFMGRIPLDFMRLEHGRPFEAGGFSAHLLLS
jgi:hypothetical protein